MTLSLDTAYRSFGGEVEASSTPTICRLPDSRRHQLWAIAQYTSQVALPNTVKEALATNGESPEPLRCTARACRWREITTAARAQSSPGLSRSDLNASLGLQVDRYEASSGRAYAQIDIADHRDKWAAALRPYPINSRLHSGAGFRGCDRNAELGRSYGLSSFVVVQVFDHSGPISRGCG